MSYDPTKPTPNRPAYETDPNLHPGASQITTIRIIDPTAPPGSPTSLKIIDNGNGHKTIVKKW